uniref:(northern house mosquito) hypothetical protein n=1 Tax=Culex pipiens TaxID=7175 RepID=A0A8D8A2X4_CULPI
MPQIKHEIGARFTQPKDLTVRYDVLHRLGRNAAALRVENRVAESLTGDIFSDQIISAGVTNDDVLRRVSKLCLHTRHADDFILIYRRKIVGEKTVPSSQRIEPSQTRT